MIRWNRKRYLSSHRVKLRRPKQALSMLTCMSFWCGRLFEVTASCCASPRMYARHLVLALITRMAIASTPLGIVVRLVFRVTFVCRGPIGCANGSMNRVPVIVDRLAGTHSLTLHAHLAEDICSVPQCIQQNLEQHLLSTQSSFTFGT